MYESYNVNGRAGDVKFAKAVYKHLINGEHVNTRTLRKLVMADLNEEVATQKIAQFVYNKKRSGVLAFDDNKANYLTESGMEEVKKLLEVKQKEESSKDIPNVIENTDDDVLYKARIKFFGKIQLLISSIDQLPMDYVSFGEMMKLTEVRKILGDLEKTIEDTIRDDSVVYNKLSFPCKKIIAKAVCRVLLDVDSIRRDDIIMILDEITDPEFIEALGHRNLPKCEVIWIKVTAFLDGSMSRGLVSKNDVGYFLTDMGREKAKALLEEE